MVCVVGDTLAPPGLHVTLLMKVMKEFSAAYAKSAPAPCGIATLKALLRVTRGPATATQLPLDNVDEVTEYAENTSYAVGDVLTQISVCA